MQNIKSFHAVVDVPELRDWGRANVEGESKHTRSGPVIRPAARKAVVIEIDLDALAKDLGVRAATNKTGKAVEASGAVRALLAR